MSRSRRMEGSDCGSEPWTESVTVFSSVAAAEPVDSEARVSAREGDLNQREKTRRSGPRGPPDAASTLSFPDRACGACAASGPAKPAVGGVGGEQKLSVAGVSSSPCEEEQLCRSLVVSSLAASFKCLAARKSIGCH